MNVNGEEEEEGSQSPSFPSHTAGQREGPILDYYCYDHQGSIVSSQKSWEEKNR